MNVHGMMLNCKHYASYSLKYSPIFRPLSESGLMRDYTSLLYALHHCVSTWKRENVWCINFTSREWNWWCSVKCAEEVWKLLQTKQAGSKGCLFRHLSSFVLLFDCLWLLRVTFYVMNFSFWAYMHVYECIWCCHSDLNPRFCFSDYVSDTCVIRSLELNYNEPRTSSTILVRSVGSDVWLSPRNKIG